MDPSHKLVEQAEPGIAGVVEVYALVGNSLVDKRVELAPEPLDILGESERPGGVV
jgi:hypothetical protein